MDFYVTPLALFPRRANYVSELEGFEAYGEWLYRQLGCLGTRKFVRDLALIHNIKRVMERKGILVLYPEARYANAGVSSRLPLSVGKLAKMLNVPVVALNMHGNYLQSPIWNLKTRKGVRLEADMTQLFTREELARATAEEVLAKLQEYLAYDEYAWQFAKSMKIDAPKRAEGLELVLYQCPDCGREFHIKSNGADLFCTSCESRWRLTELGRLHQTLRGGRAAEEPARFPHLPDWYEWQRGEVVKKIDAGAYSLEIPVRIDALPNAKNFIDLGEGFLKHNSDGFFLTLRQYGEIEESTLHFRPASMLSVHTEYDYRRKGQCITLSEPDNTWFLFPKGDGFNVTKIQFATEYLHDCNVAREALIFE
jgi:hypothetical protein